MAESPHIPALSAHAVTPDDDNDLTAGNASALYIGTSGDVNVITVGGTTATFVSHPVGYLPCRIQRVLSASTTASDILALYHG